MSYKLVSHILGGTTGPAYGARPSSSAVAALVAQVIDRSPIALSFVHGEEHWRRCALAGHKLAALTPEADELLVLLFALLHDSCRVSEEHDPGHSRRAAEWAQELLEDGELLTTSARYG